MPIYEYRCTKCGRISQFLVRSMATHTTPACPRCGAASMARVISRVTVIGGRKGRRAAAAEAEPEPAGAVGPPPADSGDAGAGASDENGFEPSEADVARMERLLESMDENDPRSIGRAMREMAAIAREPIEGEMEEVIRRLESGEDPDKIEEQMGDALGGGDDGGDELYDG